MRSALIFAVALFTHFTMECLAQSPNVVRTQQIARSEKQRFDAMHNAVAQSLASGNFVVNYYRCEWNIDPAIRYISGSVTSYFTLTAASSQIIYDFTNELTVDSIIFHRNLVSFSQNKNNTLVIHFPSTISLNIHDSVSVFYHGVPPVDGDFTESFTQTTHGNSIPVIWTLSEPFGAKGWWPCRNGLDDKADSIDIYITHPSQYKASSNGVLVSTTVKGDTITSHYRHRYPIASYLVAIAVTNYSIDARTISINGFNLPLIQYVYPEDLATFQARTFIVSNALQLYSSNFGLYPFSKERYGQTEFSWSGGMEHQTNSFVSSATENLMVHELGHQWFGDKVTCGSWQDIWLNESFATYLADIFYTEKIDTAYYKPYVEGDLSYIVSKKGGSVWVPDTANSDRIFDSRLSYDKGAFLLRMLRWTLGDSAFFKGLNQYLTDPQLSYGFARTADLQRNLEKASGQDLNYFFDQWFYGEGYPSFTVQWNQDSLTGKMYFVVREKTSVPQSVDFFTVALPVQLIGTPTKKMVTLQCGYNNQQFTVEDPGFKANSIAIDPDDYLISAHNRAVKNPSLQISEVPSSQSIQILVTPNPVTNIATVTLKNIEGKTGLRLFNSAGVEVWNNNIDITHSAQLAIPFVSYPAGVYRLVVTEANGSSSSVSIVK